MLTRTRPGTGDVLRRAAELVDRGFSVALDRVAADDVAAVLGRLDGAGLAEHCEVTLAVDRLSGAESLVGLTGSLALAGTRDAVMAAGRGQPALATADPRLVAIIGERAAWNDRTADSWEHVMPYGVRVHDQRRLLAAGYRVRVVVGTRR